jgi:hypothetical protein
MGGKVREEKVKTGTNKPPPNTGKEETREKTGTKKRRSD